jgi:hypothetical protein
MPLRSKASEIESGDKLRRDRDRTHDQLIPPSSRIPEGSRFYSKVLPVIILIMGVLTLFVILVAIAAFIGVFP